MNSSARWWREYSEFLASPTWRALRYACLRRDGYRCTRCHATTQLQAHHIRYSRNIWNTRLSDLRTLCLRCHQRTHHRRFPGVIPAGRGGPGQYPRPRYERAPSGLFAIGWRTTLAILVIGAILQCCHGH